MIKRFWGRNVGVLGDFSVELQPLTVLVGPNASGKSTFLRAMRCLAMLTKIPAFHRQGSLRLGYRSTIADLISIGQGQLTLGADVQQGGDVGSYEITVELIEGRPQIEAEKAFWKPVHGPSFSFEDGKPEFSYFDLNGKQLSSKFPRDASLPVLCGYLQRNDLRRREELRPLYRLVDAFAPFHVYRFSPAAIAKPAAIGEELQHDGAGLAAELDDLVGGDRAAFDQISRQLSDLFGHIKQLNLGTIRTPGGGIRDRGVLKGIVFEREGGTSVSAEMESDGVLLSLAHLVPSVKRNAPAFGIEEPETGTYPSLLKSRVDLFQSIVKGTLGSKPVQVILTTHSPTLLTYVGDPTLVRIFDPKKDHVSIYEPPETSMMDVINTRLSWSVGTAH